MQSDVLWVANHLYDAPQQRLHGDFIESNHMSIEWWNSSVHIQTLVAEYRIPKQRHASLNSFLRAQQSTVRNEQSDVGMIYKTHNTLLEFQFHEKLRRYFLSSRLRISLSIPLCLRIYLSLSIYLSLYFSVYIYTYLYHIPLDPSTYLLIYPSTNQFLCIPTYLPSMSKQKFLTNSK
jgi:hypothetical protein